MKDNNGIPHYEETVNENHESTEFLHNEDHIEFVGNILGMVFESEEEALDALSRIFINGKRLTDINDLEEAVRIIRDAMAAGGTDAVEVEVNGSPRPLDFSDSDNENSFLLFGEPDKKKKHKKKPKKEENEPTADSEKSEKETEEEAEKEPEKPQPEEDFKSEDVYTFAGLGEFNLNFDSYTKEIADVGGIAVISRLSGIPLSGKGADKDSLERAAGRLYVNSVPAAEFYGLGNKERLTEEDYNTLGRKIADTLNDTFIDGKKGNYVMFRKEGENRFNAFTMIPDPVMDKEPEKVELYSSLRRAFSSKENIEKNRTEYDNYVNNAMPQYKRQQTLMEISKEAEMAANSIISVTGDKVKRVNLKSLQGEKGADALSPTAPAPIKEKSLEKDPQLMSFGKKNKSHFNND